MLLTDTASTSFNLIVLVSIHRYTKLLFCQVFVNRFVVQQMQTVCHWEGSIGMEETHAISLINHTPSPSPPPPAPPPQHPLHHLLSLSVPLSPTYPLSSSLSLLFNRRKSNATYNYMNSSSGTSTNSKLCTSHSYKLYSNQLEFTVELNTVFTVAPFIHLPIVSRFCESRHKKKTS